MTGVEFLYNIRAYYWDVHEISSTVKITINCNPLSQAESLPVPLILVEIVSQYTPVIIAH